MSAPALINTERTSGLVLDCAAHISGVLPNLLLAPTFAPAFSKRETTSGLVLEPATNINGVQPYWSMVFTPLSRGNFSISTSTSAGVPVLNTSQSNTSSGTPSPVSYTIPRLYCGSASPCSAANKSKSSSITMTASVSDSVK